MNAKLLLILLVAAVLIGGVVFVQTRKLGRAPTQNQSASQSQSLPEASVNKVTVTVTSSGFDPQVITIKQGALVLWANQSGGIATVNSDDHPSHKLYPQLNLGEFTQDSSVQLLFTKKGTYTYHDHLFPEREGTVVVE